MLTKRKNKLLLCLSLSITIPSAISSSLIASDIKNKSVYELAKLDKNKSYYPKDFHKRGCGSFEKCNKDSFIVYVEE